MPALTNGVVFDPGFVLPPMNFKDRLRSIELPFIITYLSLWVLIYLSSRIVLEMTVDERQSTMLIWAAIVSAPIVIYGTLRVGFAGKAKWNGFLGYYLMFSLFGIFMTQYMLIQSKLLYDVAMQDEVQKTVQVTEVKRVFTRRSGPNHTAVTFNLDGKPVTMKARAYAYFYLHDKKMIDITFGKSDMGDYVTNIALSSGDKMYARWLHLKDFVYRLRYIGLIILAMIIGGLIKGRYFPTQPGKPPTKVSFWKMMGIIMAILITIAILLYIGLWVYVTFIANHR